MPLTFLRGQEHTALANQPAYDFVKDTQRPGSPPGRQSLAVLLVYELLFLVTDPHQQLLELLLLLAFRASGDEGIRTPGLCRARAALSQLSYIPRQSTRGVGLSGLEPETSPLSEARSNQLS